MKILLIDDIRNLPATKVARDYFSGIEALENAEWDILLLDHDLACYDEDGKEWTGYDVMCWLEANPEHLPKQEIRIVSSNPVGRDRMQSVIDKLYMEQLPEYMRPQGNDKCPVLTKISHYATSANCLNLNSCFIDRHCSVKNCNLPSL